MSSLTLQLPRRFMRRCGKFIALPGVFRVVARAAVSINQPTAALRGNGSKVTVCRQGSWGELVLRLVRIQVVSMR